MSKSGHDASLSMTSALPRSIFDRYPLHIALRIQYVIRYHVNALYCPFYGHRRAAASPATRHRNIFRDRAVLPFASRDSEAQNLALI